MLRGGGWRGGDRAPTWLPSPRLHTPTWRGVDGGRVSPPWSFSPHPLSWPGVRSLSSGEGSQLGMAPAREPRPGSPTPTRTGL